MSQYVTGTVAVTNGSASVTGTGTAWSANIVAGDVLIIIGGAASYQVASVGSDTGLTLTADYGGTTASGLSYALSRDFTPVFGLPYPQDGDIGTGQLFKRAMLAIDTLLASRGNGSTAVQSVTTTAPPSSPSVGQTYVVPPSPSGAWVGQTNSFAVWNGTGWLFSTPTPGNQAFATDTSLNWLFTGSAWQADEVETVAGRTGNVVLAQADIAGLTTASSPTFAGLTLTGALSGAGGAFTTLSASSTVSGAGFAAYLASPPAIGGSAAAAGAFTTLSASSTVSGAGFAAYLASPPAIGGTAAAAGTFTTAKATSLALGGATIGPNALAVTGSISVSSTASFSGTVVMGNNQALSWNNTASSNNAVVKVDSSNNILLGDIANNFSGSVYLQVAGNTAARFTTGGANYITLAGSSTTPALGTNAGGLSIGSAGGATTLSDSSVSITHTLAVGAISSGTISASGSIIQTDNIGGTNPTIASTVGLIIAENLSSGQAEVNFFNTYQGAATSYDFRQQTGNSTSESLMALATSGLFISNGLANSLTLAGSATNPTIGTSGGNLALSAATGVVSAPALAIGGASIGSNKLAVSGDQILSGGLSVGSTTSQNGGVVVSNSISANPPSSLVMMYSGGQSYLFSYGASTGAVSQFNLRQRSSDGSIDHNFISQDTSYNVFVGTGSNTTNLQDATVNVCSSSAHYVQIGGSSTNPTIGTNGGNLALTTGAVIIGGSGLSELSSIAGTALTLAYNGTIGIQISGTGSTNVTFNQYGAGTLSTNSSGVISASSDQTLKVFDSYLKEGALDAVMKMEPLFFFWNAKQIAAGQDRGRQLGFFAQHVQKTLGKETVPDPRPGAPFGIHDRGVIAYLTAAIQELNITTDTRLRALESTPSTVH
jgi:hypothetical protein